MRCVTPKIKAKPAQRSRQWAREKINGGRKVSELQPNEFLRARKETREESLCKLLRQGRSARRTTGEVDTANEFLHGEGSRQGPQLRG